jgi:hypothetical protein
MRIGLVTWWFNRGQATVMRTLRHALDECGHETFVLAKPTAERFARPNHVSHDDVWADHRNVTLATSTAIPTSEYVGWAEAEQLDVVIVFQNLDFDGLEALRQAGVRTIGTYMWEAFGADEARETQRALDVVFAMHPASVGWFDALGLHDVPLIRFAAHPAIAAARRDVVRDGPVSFMFAAGYLSARKPVGAAVQAFQRGASADATLTLKAQTTLRRGDLLIANDVSELHTRHRAGDGGEFIERFDDERIRIVTEDLPEASFLASIQAHDVVVGVSRWEGLGLHLYECEALGVPLILNRMEPYVSFAAEGGAIELVDSHAIGAWKSGLQAHEIDVDSLAASFAALSDRSRLADLRASEQVSYSTRWEQFVAAAGTLVEP